MDRENIHSFMENSIKKGLLNGPHGMMRRTTMKLITLLSDEERGRLWLKIEETIEGETDTVGKLGKEADLLFKNFIDDMLVQDQKWTAKNEADQAKSKLMNEAKKLKALKKEREFEQLRAQLQAANSNPNLQGTYKEPTRNLQGTMQDPNITQHNTRQDNPFPTQSNPFPTEFKTAQPDQQSATMRQRDTTNQQSQPIGGSHQQNSQQVVSHQQAVSGDPNLDRAEQLRRKISFNEKTTLPHLANSNASKEQLDEVQREIDQDKAELAKLEQADRNPEKPESFTSITAEDAPF